MVTIKDNLNRQEIKTGTSSFVDTLCWLKANNYSIADKGRDSDSKTIYYVE